LSTPLSAPGGADDRFIAPSYARLFLDRSPGAVLETIPRAGHLIGAEQPEAYARALLQFGS
jgi:pimeloyl-ACP methyl ester carboxylesterase